MILTLKNDALQVLLVKRLTEPFKDKWAIPGGYIRLSENLDQAADVIHAAAYDDPDAGCAGRAGRSEGHVRF